MITVERYHDISMGHRVVGHENKCRHLHGHNYRIHFTCTANELDDLGRVIDFSLIKAHLGEGWEVNWDHKMVLWQEDPLLEQLKDIVPEDIVTVPFNPTAEQLAQYLVTVVGPQQLAGTGVKLISVKIDETRKCSASYSLV